MLSPLGSLRQLGFALVVGILVDAVLVRPLLVPCGHWLVRAAVRSSHPISSFTGERASTPWCQTDCHRFGSTDLEAGDVVISVSIAESAFMAAFIKVVDRASLELTELWQHCGGIRAEVSE